MTRRLATLMLRLYPLAFRRRYGEEMRALIGQTPARPLMALDLLRGALAAHVRPPAGLTGFVGADDRLRASTSGVLACWVIFAAAGFGFYKSTEDGPFAAAGHAHALLGITHVSVQALAVLASIAVLAGALPLIVAAVGHARRRRSLWILVSLPIAALVVFSILTALLVWYARSQHPGRPSTTDRAAFIAWLLAGLGCAAVCVVASRRALFAVPVARRWLAWALACSAVVTAAMAAMALATAVYALALGLDAARLAGAADGPLGATSTTGSLIMQLIVMAGSGALAVVTTLRGWRMSRPQGGLDSAG